ncbi:MAG: NAD-dependent epimerase/dehydratase family protein [Acidobacteriaceae bacterium]|nr:NAD-dependent epimerase/dehydratase family protein [Acidobacteriaceae bacterium]
MQTKPLAPLDLAHVLENAGTALLKLRGAHLFLTGGTGFFGHWLLESLLYANQQLGLGLHITALTRSAAAFQARSPHLASDPALTFLEGDIRNFEYPARHVTHILHAATDSTGAQAKQAPYHLSESILDGTRHVLRLALRDGASSAAPKIRLLYVSTGAVYGRSTTLLNTPETYSGSPDPLQVASAYDEAKRMAENLCISFAAEGHFEPVIARCFSFLGPHLPLDAHFAIGNFLAAALEARPIHIKGDGTPRRSWLYMADLAVWLWTMLCEGAAGRAYNVGSNEGYTIAEAAQLTAATLHPGLPIRIDQQAKSDTPLNSYVPEIQRAQQELGLHVRIGLPEALERTAAWHKSV